MQVRVRAGHEESRVALPQRFADAAMTAGAASPNLIRERTLVDRGVRYGELPDIAALVAVELDAAYDDARLAALVAQAEAMGDAPEAAPEPSAAETLTPSQVLARLDDADWKARYAALERFKPTPETMNVVVKALADDNFSVRRLAVVYLGDLKTPEAVQRLTAMLKDPSVAVRRTAGDALSDIGDASAQPAMIEALGDKSKIVRWRAARYLYDLGDDAALPALRAASDDPEFEVALQARMAVERIASGEAAAGTVWQQMAKSRET
jgi:HEAT repeat protein